jgi:hypothetical protein
MFFIAGASLSVHAQEGQGYTFVRGIGGIEVCLGRWVPPADVGKLGYCEGDVVNVDQLTAMSSWQTVGRLDQMLLTLSVIDQKMAFGNDLLRQLVDVATTFASSDRRTSQASERLREKIAERFDELPEELLTVDVFREELSTLRENILQDMENYFPAQSSPLSR